MRKQRFHIDDWMDYYHAELDDEDFRELIFKEDRSQITSVYFDGTSNIRANLKSNVVSSVHTTIINEETDEETEEDVEFSADFEYSVDYRLDESKLKKYIKDLNHALNRAIDQEAYKFEVRVPFVASEAYDICINIIDVCDDEATEDDIYLEVLDKIESGLTHLSSEKSARYSIKPPTDKDVRFICRIPDEE